MRNWLSVRAYQSRGVKHLHMFVLMTGLGWPWAAWCCRIEVSAGWTEVAILKDHELFLYVLSKFDYQEISGLSSGLSSFDA